ncbi:MAG: hypothetical protein GX348_07700 [Veillonellaceae bacterium]|jgi:hypothetical protein|nr:hypothetical protein [Veillonellaceae bacterium]
MLEELMTSMATDKLAELKKDPTKHEEFVRMVVSALDMSTELLKESPEFRQAFARVHTEFFKYPECQETIAAIKKAAHG